MNYIAFVKKNQAKFELAGILKLALDTANLLDNLLRSLDLNAWNAEEEVALRERVYHILCAVCFRSQVRLPRYEKIFFEAWLPKFDKYVKDDEREKKVKQADLFGQQVRDRVKGRKNKVAQLCRAVAKAYELFPMADNSFRGIKPKQLEAIINQNLIRQGLDPIRPDYSEVKIPDCREQPSPARETRVLIVDDSLEDIVKSALALVGWPGVNLFFFHYAEGKKNKDYATTADKVLAREPDIILMDQGLSDLNGHEMVEVLKSKAQRRIIFVGNTGGDARELHSVGCLGNFDKGKSLRGFIQALQMIR